MSSVAIQAKSVSKFYGGVDGVAAVEQVDLTVSKAERVAVVGKSGSGKSTLLNLLAGLDQPSAGELIVQDLALHELSQVEMARYRLETVGVIFQAFHLIPQRTALQNVELPLIISGMETARRRELAQSWLTKVGLEHRLDHHPYELSGGEQQRVAIARALVNEPRVVLADEPTGNLDSGTANEIVELLISLCESTEATFLLVTHDQDVADRICSQKFQMRDGHLAEITA